MVKPKVSLVGKQFGRLTVLEQVEEDYVAPSGGRCARYRCVCNCGLNNEIITSHWNLTSGDTKSCGCLVKEAAKKKGKKSKKYITYDLSGDYGIGITPKKEEFWFDKEDYDLIKPYYWFYEKSGYLVAHIKEDGKQKEIRLHRLVMNAKENEIIDHKVHPPRKEHKYDNRKENLRRVTDKENAMNAHLNINNKSGVTGVRWHKGKRKWEVGIGVNNKWKYLGSYVNFEDAVEVRKRAEEKYFGEYSFDNSQNVS